LGGGSQISGTGEPLTARPPEAEAQPIDALPSPEAHPEGSNGSSPNGSSANGRSAASPSLVGLTVEGTVTGITHFGAFVNGKYDLSLKQTREAPAAVLPKWRRGRRDKVLPEGADPLFEEKLSKFMKSSEERLLDVKRNLESKRGGRFK